MFLVINTVHFTLINVGSMKTVKMNGKFKIWIRSHV